ncbi:MAG: hypothetical protein E7L06_07505 [Schaalia turicensis]|nr:hypothetical protein [Schaalia turicensis]
MEHYCSIADGYTTKVQRLAEAEPAVSGACANPGIVIDNLTLIHAHPSNTAKDCDAS